MIDWIQFVYAGPEDKPFPRVLLERIGSDSSRVEKPLWKSALVEEIALLEVVSTLALLGHPFSQGESVGGQEIGYSVEVSSAIGLASTYLRRGPEFADTVSTIARHSTTQEVRELMHVLEIRQR